jgi:mRNA interferase RelE/StbE
MNFTVEFLPEAINDLKKLDGSVRPQILKGIRKVSLNPLSDGYGKPLGNLSGTDLSGLMKIKFKKLGIRVVYKVEMTCNVMKIIIVSARADNKVYDEAENRRKKYGI